MLSLKASYFKQRDYYMKTNQRSLIILIIFTMLIGAVSFCYAKEYDFADVSKFEGKKIGIETGSSYVYSIHDFIKNADVKYFASATDLLTALKSGKVDAIVSDECQLLYATSTDKDIICERLKSYPDYIAPIVAKDSHGDKLIKELNAFISEIKANGKLDKLIDKWLSGSNTTPQMKDYTKVSGKRGVIVIASDPTYAPFEFVSDNHPVGFDIELMGMFCESRGYKPKFESVDFDGIITGLVSGKYDIGASCFSTSKERAKIVNFSDTVYTNYAGIATLNKKSSSVLGSITKGFTNTFITESRWKAFMSGIYVTLLITIISILFGTFLGFLAHIVCRKSPSVFAKIFDFLSWLIKGMPEIVLLMILFYIVFGSSEISATIVSIVTFTLIFTCSVRDMLKQGESSIDNGQIQAATALGYKDNAIFFKIILPQVIKKILPSYAECISSHIKATAIVGYIAVVDVTKVGDIVRGRTYDAFFPLVSVAIIYFVMAGILKFAVKHISNKIDESHKRKNQIKVDIEEI